VGERVLVDGYLSDPLPVGVAIRAGADVIVAVGFESDYQDHITSLPRFAFQISSITSNNLLRTNFAFHNLVHHADVIPIIPSFSERIRLFDTDKIPLIVAEGERAAEAALDQIRSALEA
jgi:NTE family protein